MLKLGAYFLLIIIRITPAFSQMVHDPGVPFADPAVIRTSDGWYYAYATQSRAQNNPQNVQVARSKDMITWEALPDAMPEKPLWANLRQNFWAPHVSFFNNQYVMYLSVEQNAWGYCIAVGTSSGAQGPFRNFKRLVCGKGFENIDPMAFHDPQSNKKFLYWGSASLPIMGQELADDGLSFKAGSKKQIVLNNRREPRGFIKHKGWIYAFGTQMGPEYEKKSNVQGMRSKDFLTWEKLPDAMPVVPSWVTGLPDHWAPQVKEVEGKFFMYLTLQKSEKDFCLAVGRSDNPQGPYEDFKPLLCSPEFKSVNPRLHQTFLVWEHPDGERMVKRELASNFKEFKKNSEMSFEVLKDSKLKFRRTGYEDLVEGAWVTFKHGYYYLYYSGDECCSEEAHYAVSVARSRSPFGPFEKKGVILKGNKSWLGTGHNSVIEDKDGNEWIFYHAIPAKRKKVKINEREFEMNRVMLRKKVKYNAQFWPSIVN